MLNENCNELLSTYFPAWDKLTENQKRLIKDNAVLTFSPKNSFIQNTTTSCSGILIIKRGTMRVYTLSEQGREITFYRLNSGDICILSASCVIKDITLDIYIDTLTDCEFIRVLPCVFARVMHENIHLEAVTYKLATQRLCTVIWVMRQIIFTSFDKRLADFLLNESQNLGSNEITMTHERIAKLMGTAREVVTRMLKYFSNENYVRLTRGKVTIIDKQALKNL